MANQNSAQEKTEEATPRRKDQARKRGSVAKSHDLTSALVIGALLVVLPGMASAWLLNSIQSLKSGWIELPTDLSVASMTTFFGRTLPGPVSGLAAVVGVVMLVGILANVAQVGFLMSSEALKPQAERINPMSGFKRLFSRNALAEGIKAVVKTALFGYLAWSAVREHEAELIGLGWRRSTDLIPIITQTLQTVGIRVGIAWLVLAGLDYLWQRYQMNRNLRMTKEEVKQEFKESETSAEVKAAQARKRRQLAKGRMKDAVRSADVVITNPTHFAVAVKYEVGKMHAPQVVAKGQDLIALKIREWAQDAGVPIVPNPPLARQLYKQCEIGDFIPRELFQAVAEVLAFVYRTVSGMR